MDDLTKWLDIQFKKFPDMATEFKALVPFFDPAQCLQPTTAPSSDPHENRNIRVDFMFPDGERRRLGMRTLVRYFVLGDAHNTMPGSGCVAGCMNPHHAVLITKGAKNGTRKPRNSSVAHKIDPVQRSLRQFAKVVGNMQEVSHGATS